MGAIAKKQDPIVATQTDPIDYKEKQKEEKEGKKGPPVPSIDLFPRRRFLMEGPVDKMKAAPPPAERQTAELWLEEGAEEPTEEGDEFKLELETDDNMETPASKRGAVS